MMRLLTLYADRHISVLKSDLANRLLVPNDAYPATLTGREPRVLLDCLIIVVSFTSILHNGQLYFTDWYVLVTSVQNE